MKQKKSIMNFFNTTIITAVALTFILQGLAVIANTIVSISPPTQDVEKGEMFFVDINVVPGEPIVGMSIGSLSFNPNLIHAVNVIQGDLFPPPPDSFFMPGNIDNITGEIVLISLVTVPPTGVSAPGTFCTIEFIAQDQYGTSVLDLEGVESADINGDPVLPIVVNDGQATAEGNAWSVTLDFDESSGKSDYVTFGEATDANDGPPADGYDIPKPPPPEPYLRAWFDDDLSAPYDLLWEDYRQYPDTDKVWDLYVSWVPSDDISPTDITVSWSRSEIISSEYASIELFDYNNNIVIAEMTLDNTYEFTASAGVHHFQIRASADNGDNGGNGGNGGQPPVNTPPVANASGSEISGFIGMYIQFNGSLSYDPDEDGYIDSWEWDFGDGETGTGETTEHLYFEEGIFNVVLTVTDNKGATGTDIFNVNIIQGPNIPPEKPVVTGPDIGHKDIVYEYTANSTDVDNTTISYIFNWGDGDTTTTDYLPKGIMTTQNHSWTAAGRYTIDVQVTDNQTYSQTTELIVMIDAVYVGEIGYLIDIDGDEIYDSFYSNTTGEETDVEDQDDGTYLIDDDGDGEWEYTFDLVNLASYEKEKNKDTPGFEFVLIISVVIISFYMELRKRKKS